MKLSIITPSLNQCDYLRHTTRTILDQPHPPELEWIVIDGGSTDGTINLLRSINDPRLKWVSEPDRGQSDAVNKGLAQATGDIVGWLNSDDLYTTGALAAVAEAMTNNPQAQWLVGRCGIINDVDQPIRATVTRYKNRSLRRYSYRRLLRENFISQPAVFWRRTFGQQVGPLDLSLYYTMDYDFWLRMGRCCQPLVLPDQLASFRLHPTSKSGLTDRRQFDEQFRVACRYTHDSVTRGLHRFNVEKIVWSYRAMNLLRF